MSIADRKGRDEVQREMVDAIAWCARNSKSAVLEAATGFGKTKVASDVVLRLKEELGWKFLFLVDEIQLREQAAIALEHWGLTVAVEGGDRRAGDLSLIERSGVDVLIATRQTLGRDGTGDSRYERALRELGWDRIHCLIIDECHVGITGAELAKVKGKVAPQFTLGLSATPYLANGTVLVPEVFERYAYRYPAENTKEKKGAISNGHLVPPYCIECQTSVDLRGLKSVVSAFGKDFSSADLDRAIGEKVGEIANAARMQIERSGGFNRGICFTPSVVLSESFASVWRSLGYRSEAMHGRHKDPESAKKRYLNGETDILCVCNMGTKGFDDRATDLLVLARPTRSYPLARQMLGRGLRLSPDTEKKRCLVIGFAWQADKEAEPVSVLDIFLQGLPEKTKSIAREVSRNKSSLGKAYNPLDLIDEVKIAEAAERKRLAEELSRATTERREVKHKARVRDVFGNEYNIGAISDDRDEKIDSPPVSGDLYNELSRFGVTDNSISGHTRATAERLLYLLKQRELAGLATQKQVAFILKHDRSYNKEKAMEVTKDEASRIIGRIRKEKGF